MAKGFLVAHVYTSDSSIPLSGSAVGVVKNEKNGERRLLAFRLTDLNGKTPLLEFDTPEAVLSQNYIEGVVPFTSVEITAQQTGYDKITVLNAQIFPNETTRQNFMLIPTAELPNKYDKEQVFTVENQNL